MLQLSRRADKRICPKASQLPPSHKKPMTSTTLKHKAYTMIVSLRIRPGAFFFAMK